jgi:hypothetical protein
MSVVMIRCPETGEEISTGIDTDSRTFRRLPHVASRLRCPACGKVHVWMKDRAWLNGHADGISNPPIDIWSA